MGSIETARTFQGVLRWLLAFHVASAWPPLPRASRLWQVRRTRAIRRSCWRTIGCCCRSIRHCGTIARILDKPSGIDLAPAPALAENFRLVLLMPDKRTVTILGKDQKLSGVSRAADRLVLNWDGPLEGHCGREAQDRRADGGEGRRQRPGVRPCTSTTAATCKVSEACYPMIGGLAGFGAPGRPADGVAWVPTSMPWTKKIELPFGSAAFAYPGQANMSFTCVQSAAAKKSLYFASHDKIARYKVYHFESTPRRRQGRLRLDPALAASLRPARPSTAPPWSCGWLTATGTPRAGSTGHGSRRPSASRSPRSAGSGGSRSSR